MIETRDTNRQTTALADAETGFSEREAAERLTSEGPNEIAAAGQRNALRVAVDVIAEPMFAVSRGLRRTLRAGTPCDLPDLLVTGGYGHGRFREFIFGGFTRRVSNGISVPALLFH